MDVKGKAMIDARQPALVIDSVIEGRAAMGAALLEQTHLTHGVPKGYQFFAEELNPHWRAIGLWEFRGQQERVPIAPE
jgi:hypothetical protein